jgi:hypothetical protein
MFSAFTFPGWRFITTYLVCCGKFVLKFAPGVPRSMREEHYEAQSSGWAIYGGPSTVVKTEISVMITAQNPAKLVATSTPSERQNKGEFHDADSAAGPRSRGCGFF